MTLNEGQHIDGVIYMTINCVNGKKYIGKDANNNKYYLGGGVTLQKAIKKYGRHSFIKLIIDRCNTSIDLFNKEKYYLSLYGAGKNKNLYNISPRPDYNGIMGKSVYNYHINGCYNKSFDTVKIAAKYYGVTKDAIRSVLYGVSKTSCGFYWSYNKTDKFMGGNQKRLDIKNPSCVPVYCYNHLGRYIKSFSSESEAIKNTGVTRSYMDRCLRNKQKSAHKKYKIFFSLKKEKRINIDKYINHMATPIVCFNKKNQLIKEYGTISLAAKDNGILRTSISNVLSGKSLTAGKYIWKYKEEAV